jgi:hypothetical protein
MISAKEIVKQLYKNEYGQPFELTEGQEQIFNAIYCRQYPRNHIMTYTQYGKSDVIAMAGLTRASTYPEKWAIIAPSGKKARIIMNYLIGHIFDNNFTRSRFKIDVQENEERIQRERNRERLTFRIPKKGIGEIFILSAEAKRIGTEAGNSLMGFGAPNLIEDESALIPNPVHSKGMRMLGGHKDNFIASVGNPFFRNHFLKSYNNSNYHKISIDYQQGLKEGRITQEYIDEMKDEAFFKVLYECKFPEADEVDEQGWTSLVTNATITLAQQKIVEPTGRKRLGIDVGRGGNYTAYIIRTDNKGWIKTKNRDPDLMSNVGLTNRIVEEENIEWEDVSIDDIGVGGGITDRLKEQGHNVNAVRFGNPAVEDKKYFNCKAEMFWDAGQWLKNGGSLSSEDEWNQLTSMRYKEDSSSKLKMEPKENLLKRGEESPDIADGFALTFFKKPIQKVYQFEHNFFKR